MNLPEPVLFSDRCDENNSENSSDCIELYGPDRTIGKKYHLHLRADTKNVPKRVKRCTACQRLFSDQDVVLIKTQGIRQYFCSKAGKGRSSEGKIYLHFLNSCVKEYDSSYMPEKVVVSEGTASQLPKAARAAMKSKGIHDVQVRGKNRNFFFVTLTL